MKSRTLFCANHQHDHGNDAYLFVFECDPAKHEFLPDEAKVLAEVLKPAYGIDYDEDGAEDLVAAPVVEKFVSIRSIGESLPTITYADIEKARAALSQTE